MIKPVLLRKASALWRVFSLALILPIAIGCQSVNRLREAQDAFNQAATLDIRTTFGAGMTLDDNTGPDAVGKWAGVRNQYGSALISLNKIEREDERILRGEKLWGAKLTLEALCHWKLGNYQKALDTARDAQKTDQLFPRDKAVMQALPGLVMVDYAFDLRPKAEALKREMAASTDPAIQLAKGKDFTNLVNKIEEFTVKPDGAVDVIQSARSPDLIEATHPAHSYFIQAQLAAYRNFRRGYELLVQTGVPPTHAAHTNAQARLDDLATRVSGPSGQKLVNDWAAWNNLTPRIVSGH